RASRTDRRHTHRRAERRLAAGRGRPVGGRQAGSWSARRADRRNEAATEIKNRNSLAWFCNGRRNSVGNALRGVPFAGKYVVPAVLGTPRRASLQPKLRRP